MAEPKLKKKWIPIDVWRGYYTYEISEEDKDRAKAIELSYVARDPEENQKYLKTAMELLKNLGFNVMKRTLPTSNIFATNVVLIAYKDRPFTPEEKAFLDQFEEAYVRYYTESFSVFTGETYPLPIEEFKKEVSERAKSLLGKVIAD